MCQEIMTNNVLLLAPTIWALWGRFYGLRPVTWRILKQTIFGLRHLFDGQLLSEKETISLSTFIACFCWFC